MSASAVPISEVRVRFGRRERRGVILGLSWLQVIVIGAAAVVAIGLLLAKAYTLLGVAAPVLLLFVAVGAGRYRREAVVVYVVHALRFWRASATRQWAAKGDPAVRRIGHMNLPGGLASIDIHETARGMGFSYDRTRRQFAFTLGMSAPAWPLLDEGSQVSSVSGFVGWMNGLSRIPGLAIVDVRIRSDFSSSTDVEDFTDTQIRGRRAATPPVARVCTGCGVPGVSPFCMSCGQRSQVPGDAMQWSDDQARQAAANTASASMEFSYEVTFGFETGSLRDRAFQTRTDRAGGGIAGAGEVLELEADSLIRGLSRAGVTDVSWLSAAGLAWTCRQAYDPETTVARKRAGLQLAGPVADTVRPMAAVRRWDHLQIDEVFHQVFWIADWPTTDIPVGFLEEVIATSGDFTRCITLQLVPVSKEAALKAVNAAQTDLDQAEAVRAKLGQRTTGEQEAEAADVTERENDLSEGYREMGFRGYITISALSREGLDVARNGIEVAAQQAQIEPKVMFLQQAEAFNTAVLPFGLGMVKR